MNLIKLSEQIKNQPVKTKQHTTPLPQNWYETGSNYYLLKRRTQELYNYGVINEDEHYKLNAIGKRIAWTNTQIKNTLHGYFAQLNNDANTYLNITNKTANTILATAIKTDTKTGTEQTYKTALSIIAQQNAAALKALHTNKLKENELYKITENTNKDVHLILLTNNNHELRLQDLYPLITNQNYKIMPTYARPKLDYGHERAITICREETLENGEIDYTYHQYRLAEINKTNQQTTITYPTKLTAEHNNEPYKHCYFLC